MSPPTLYAPGLAGALPDLRITLSPDEAKHIRALRIGEGADIRVTDGQGNLWDAELETAERGSAVCRLRGRTAGPPALAVRLMFGVGAKDRTLWLVEKATELGARTLAPVETRRSASVGDAARSAGFWRRAERRAVAALKQSGGAHLPELRPPVPLAAALDPGLAGPDRQDPARRLVGDDSATTTLTDRLHDWDGVSVIDLLIGPEGGLTGSELESCRAAGFETFSLGPRTLRFETAAVAALGVLSGRARF